VSYHVFIEGAQNPANASRVAAAVAQRYGMPVEAIAQRMAAGRFRVKADVDMETARKFAADLQRLGAVATIVDAATGKPAVASGTPAPAPLATKPGAPAPVAQRPPAIPSGGRRIDAATARTLTAAPGPAAASPASAPKQDYSTGLAAAFGKEDSNPDLGALERHVESGELALASLDGHASEKRAAAPATFEPAGADAFAPPDADDEDLQLLDTAPPAPARTSGAVPVAARTSGAVAAARVSGATPVPAAAPAAADDGMFAPPAEEDVVALVDIETPPPRRTPAPMPAQAAPPPPDADAPAPARPAPPRPRLGELVRTHFIERTRVRFAAGVALVVVLAWIPARLYWGAQVEGEQAALTATMQEAVAAAGSDVDAWKEFEHIGRAQLALSESRLVNQRITSILIWMVVCGLLTYAYFRKIPWDRL
jgi:hypothetical protein